MGLEQRKTIYGVHSVALYDPATGLPLGGIAKVVGSLALNLSGDLVQLTGGSLPFPWKVQEGQISTEITFLLKEYPDFVFEAFLGKAITNNAAESDGNVSTATNVSGTLIDATTGIASVTAKSGETDDLKTGKYVLKAVSATTVDLYSLSDIDFSNGANVDFDDDTLKVNATPIAISGSGGTIDVADFGLTITGGSGTVALTTGDTASFEVRAANTGSQEVIVGDVNFKLPEVGVIAYAQKDGDNTIYEIDLFRCKGAGLPITFAEKAFSESEIPLQAFYDSTQKGLFKMRRVSNKS